MWTMTEETASKAEPTTFHDVLKSLVGHVVTIANPESYEIAMGGVQKITTGFYKAKVLTVNDDYVAWISEFTAGKGAKKEPVKTFIPLAWVKRVSLLKSERLIHL
jgi:hypothetical protein